jgi:hypothetical protein
MIWIKTAIHVGDVHLGQDPAEKALFATQATTKVAAVYLLHKAMKLSV